jgi:hypothetical protein
MEGEASVWLADGTDMRGDYDRDLKHGIWVVRERNTGKQRLEEWDNGVLIGVREGKKRS